LRPAQHETRDFDALRRGYAMRLEGAKSLP